MQTVNSPSAVAPDRIIAKTPAREVSQQANTAHRGRTVARGRRGTRVWRFAVEHLLLLPVGATAGLVWANAWPASYFTFAASMHFLVNDVLMVLFFGLIAKEVVEATASGGVLHPWRRAAAPMMASLGLTILPLLAYAVAVPQFDEPRVLQGWPVVFATDLAVGYFLARVIFGNHPVIPFFVLLGICANALGIVALAAVADATQLRAGLLLTLMACALGTAGLLRRARVRSLWAYILGAGGLSWCALHFGGLEPALALVPVLPFVPHASRDPGFFVDARPNARDTLSRFELWSRHPAQIGLLLFGLASAGVPLRALDWGTLALPLTTLAMKPLGLLVGAALAVALGLRLPDRIGWRELVVVGVIASVGFTMALFFATAAIGPGPTLSALKMGALVSLSGALLALGAAAVLRTGRFGR